MINFIAKYNRVGLFSKTSNDLVTYSRKVVYIFDQILWSLILNSFSFIIVVLDVVMESFGKSKIIFSYS